MLIGSNKSLEAAYDYLKELGIGTDDELRSLPKQIVSTYIKATGKK